MGPTEEKLTELRAKWGRIQRMDVVPAGYDGEIWVRLMNKFDARKYFKTRIDSPELLAETTAEAVIVWPEEQGRIDLLDAFPFFAQHVENFAVLASGLGTDAIKKG